MGTGRLDPDKVLVSTDWLEQNLDNPDIQVVDARFFPDRDGYDVYKEGHIPGAVHLDHGKALNDKNSDVDGMIGPADQIAQAFGNLGIGDDTTIVVYDQEGGHFGGRIWLILERYGKSEQLRLLDGGWTRWVKEGRPTSTEIPEPTPRQFTIDPARENPEIIASLDDVRQASENNDAVILDVRRWSEYTGEEVRAKHGGRVPGATFHFWQDNLHWDDDRSHKSMDEIRREHEEQGINPDTPIITYCQGAVRAAHSALALKMAGYTNVRVYDGSWAEWGNRDDVPIETGDDSDGSTD